MGVASTRLDSFFDLNSIFDRATTDTNGGGWRLDLSGSTSTGFTGPGANSGGPYVFSESSLGPGEHTGDTVTAQSTLTVKATVMTAWTGNGRRMLLRACVQGLGFATGDGFLISGRASSSDGWAEILLITPWAYSDSYTAGDTVGGNTIVQAGGWVDFDITIPDTYTEVRLQNAVSDAGTLFQKDAALWSVELRDGPTATSPEVSITAGADITEGGDATFTVTASPAPTTAVTVNYTTTATGAFGVTPGTGTVSIPTTGSATITISTTGDTTAETAGTVTVTLNTGTGYTVSTTGDSATVAIADDDTAAVAPAFATTSGPDQTWTADEAITSITVPVATGTPTPTYAEHNSSLPAGLTFNPTTRVISGTPTTPGTGTITIRATNTAGTADWTVDYTITALLVLADFTVPDGQQLVAAALIEVEFDTFNFDFLWAEASAFGRAQQGEILDGDLEVGSGYDISAFRNYSANVVQYNDNPDGADIVAFFAENGGGHGFTAHVQDSGGSSSFVVADQTVDATSNSNRWRVNVSADFYAIVNRQMTGSRFILAFTEPMVVVNTPATGAPAITGTAQVGQTLTAGIGTIADANGLPTTAFPTGYTFQWNRAGTAITGATVRTYIPVTADVGSVLTVAVSFTDRAGNNESRTSAATAAVLAAPNSAPVFATDTGAAQSWVVGQAITPIIVPAANGSPTPTYAAAGALPGGLTFTAASRMISGTPTAAGNGTITIRASNVEGSDDWTVAYTIIVVPTISVQGGNAIVEGNDAVFTLSSSPNPSSNLTINYAITAAGNFGVTTGNDTITMPTSGAVVVRVSTSDDTTDEPNGSVTLTLRTGTGYVVHGTNNAATITIEDDEEDVVAGTAYTSIPARRRLLYGVRLQVSGTGRSIISQRIRVPSGASHVTVETLSRVDSQTGAASFSAGVRALNAGGTQIGMQQVSTTAVRTDFRVHTSTLTIPNNTRDVEYYMVVSGSGGADAIDVRAAASRMEFESSLVAAKVRGYAGMAVARR